MSNHKVLFRFEEDPDKQVVVEVDNKDKMQQYKKMHIQNLKKLVLSKGLAEDVSKLKKADLLVILQEE